MWEKISLLKIRRNRWKRRKFIREGESQGIISSHVILSVGLAFVSLLLSYTVTFAVET